MSKTANQTHRRTMRTVTPVARTGRAGAGAAMAAAMLFGGASAATAEPQADAPRKQRRWLTVTAVAVGSLLIGTGIGVAGTDDAALVDARDEAQRERHEEGEQKTAARDAPNGGTAHPILPMMRAMRTAAATTATKLRTMASR